MMNIIIVVSSFTPSQRHHGQSEVVIAKRIEVNEKARSLHPERWTKDICRWNMPSSVFLNPGKKNQPPYHTQ